MKKDRTEHFIARKIGKAINRYNMIKEGDKVLVAVSGGKDSLTLLRILEERKRWVPIDYTVKAIHVTTDYDKRPEVKMDELKAYFESIGCEYLFKETAIEEKNKTGRQDCFWCSWNRRKVIFDTAGKIGFNKIAMGHHKDDIVETILMNMIWGGELSSINPVQELFGGKLTIIRPLVFLEEEELRRYAEDIDLPVIKADCPRSRDSKRAVIKDIIVRLSRENRGIKTNILNAPHRIRTEYLTEIREEDAEHRAARSEGG